MSCLRNETDDRDVHQCGGGVTDYVIFEAVQCIASGSVLYMDFDYGYAGIRGGWLYAYSCCVGGFGETYMKTGSGWTCRT